MIVAPVAHHAQRQRPPLPHLSDGQPALTPTIEADQPLAAGSPQDVDDLKAHCTLVPTEHSLGRCDVVRLWKEVVPCNFAAARPSALPFSKVEQVLLLVLRLHHRLPPRARHHEHVVPDTQRRLGRSALAQQRRNHTFLCDAPTGTVLAIIEFAVTVGVAAALTTLGVNCDEQLARLLALQSFREFGHEGHAVHRKHVVTKPHPTLFGHRTFMHLGWSWMGALGGVQAKGRGGVGVGSRRFRRVRCNQSENGMLWQGWFGVAHRWHISGMNKPTTLNHHATKPTIRVKQSLTTGWESSHDPRFVEESQHLLHPVVVI